MSAWTIQSVREAIAAKNVSARELAAEFYKRIEERNPVLNAFLTLCPDRASTQAQRIDGLVAAKKPLPPLAGVPVAVKDVISTRGIRTTCGSKILENHIPAYDATAVERLEAAEQAFLGRPNWEEFAMAGSTKNLATGLVRTPLQPGRVPAGSTAGPAAAD